MCEHPDCSRPHDPLNPCPWCSHDPFKGEEQCRTGSVEAEVLHDRDLLQQDWVQEGISDLKRGKLVERLPIRWDELSEGEKQRLSDIEQNHGAGVREPLEANCPDCHKTDKYPEWAAYSPLRGGELRGCANSWHQDGS